MVKNRELNTWLDEIGDKYLDFSLLYNCHSSKDTIDSIDVNDMKEFVEEVVVKILS